MFLGLSIKNKYNNINSKPFIISYDNNIFYAEIIKESDFSIIVDKNEVIEFDIIKYNQKNEIIKILGKYSIKINLSNSLYKVDIKEFINDKYKLEIKFSAIQLEKNNNKKFVLTQPYIKGYKSFLQ